MVNENKEKFYRQSLIICWIALVQLVMVMFIMALLSGAVNNEFTRFSKDPGEAGIKIMIIVFTIYIILPLLIKLIDHKIFRWTIFGLCIFFFLFFLAHQLTHMIVDKMPLGLHHTLDFAHHIIMILAAVLTFLWARAGKNNNQPSLNNT